ncbi:Hypp830 [Branchiostoma lanceolatum]|uniref:Hypp830 protein n=1 Tax=Branchiostoma lanceolatum TaxID=7740 RepID=A0A8J9YRI6_BRALA|nr:Hypp830 [Branchiostoma lanceolatum]
MACLCSGRARRKELPPGLPDAPPLSTDQLIAKWQAENSTERDEGYHSYHGPTSSTGHQGLQADGEKPAVTKNSARWCQKRQENGRRKHKKVMGEKLRQPRWDTHVRQAGWDSDSDFDQDSPELDEPPFTVFDREAELLIRGATKRRPANVQAVVINSFVPDSPDQLNVARGDVVKVLYRTEDWVRVANVWRDRGFIPYSYVWPLGRRTPRKPERQRPYSPPPPVGQPGGIRWTCPRRELEQDPMVVVSDSPNLSDDSQSDDAGGGFFARLQHGPALTVLFDFRAIDEDDVTVSRGETVTLLNEEDADWVWVRNRSGREGFIPRGYAVQTCEVCRVLLRKNLQRPHSSCNPWEREATRGLREQAHTGPPNENAPPSTFYQQLVDEVVPPQDRQFVFEEQNTMSFSQKVASDTTAWQGNGEGQYSAQRPQGWQKVPHKQQRTLFTTGDTADRYACTCVARMNNEGLRWQKEQKVNTQKWTEGCQISSKKLADSRDNSQGVIRESLRRKTASDDRKSLGWERKEQQLTRLPIIKKTGAAKKEKGVCSEEKESGRTSLKEQEAGSVSKKSPWWNLETSQDCNMILRENAPGGQTWEQEQSQFWEQGHGQNWEQDQGRTWEQEHSQTWKQGHGQNWEQDQGPKLGTRPEPKLGTRAGPTLGTRAGPNLGTSRGYLNRKA